MAKPSPTSRSLKVLRDRGYTAQVVEHWNQYARIRQDLFGCIDIIAVRDGETLAVQACAGSSAAARVAKILAEPRAYVCAKAGWKIVVWAWRKVGKKDERKLWELREIEVDLSGAPPTTETLDGADEDSSAVVGPEGDQD